MGVNRQTSKYSKVLYHQSGTVIRAGKEERGRNRGSDVEISI